MPDKDTYLAEARAKIDQWNADIDKLQAAAAEAGADAKVEYDKQIDALRTQRDEVEAKLKDMADASGDAWQDMKAGFDKAWDTVSDAFTKAMSRFK